jgi:hypothetical protein
MPTPLVDAMEEHDGDLRRAVEWVDACLGAGKTPDELTAALETVRRRLFAHDVTAERFVVGPLRHLHVPEADRLCALEDEAHGLWRDALVLARGEPDRAAVAAFVRRLRDHIERQARIVVPTVRAALASGRLTPVPRWYVEEIYELQGGRSGSWAEEWLG